MHLACSSVFCGGGTNQELAHHCLYECKGDIMVSTTEQSILTDEAVVFMVNRKMTGSCVLHRADALGFLLTHSCTPTCFLFALTKKNLYSYNKCWI